MMLTKYNGRCGACDRATKAGAGIYERRSVMCRICAWDFASDDPRMAAGLTRLGFARPAARVIPTFAVGDRAGHPSHRGGYDAIIIVASIHTDSNGTQHLSGPDTSNRYTGLQGSLCKKLKSHAGDARFLAWGSAGDDLTGSKETATVITTRQTTSSPVVLPIMAPSSPAPRRQDPSSHSFR